MGAKSLASIGWQSRRVRIAMSDGAWAYVEEAARAAGIYMRDFIPILIGRGIEHSFAPFETDLAPDVFGRPLPAVPGPGGQMYQQTTLPEIGLTQELEG